MSQRKRTVKKEKICYVDVRKVNWGYIFWSGIGTAIWLMNLIFMIWFLGWDDPISLVFLINFIFAMLVTAYYQIERYEPMYKRHYVRQE